MPGKKNKVKCDWGLFIINVYFNKAQKKKAWLEC